MKGSHWVNAAKEVRPRGGFSEETAEVLESVAAIVAAGMMEPYGEAFLARFRLALAGQEAPTAPEDRKSPAQRAATAKGRSAGKGKGKRGKAAKHCPKCKRGAGFGATHCQYDGTALA